MNKENINELGKKLEFLFNKNQRDFGYVEAILDIKYKANLPPKKNINTNKKYK
ncbi:hypothetical protein [Paraclostridium bifermentans]|uniref:hypothetical protein n=1 Tax=Paraclostridium bifermentans TaxID=1490 RepID=UPI0018AA39A2|nr:hypothetical protein [Paraclostridium bifermentans]